MQRNIIAGGGFIVPSVVRDQPNYGQFLRDRSAIRQTPQTFSSGGNLMGQGG